MVDEKKGNPALDAAMKLAIDDIEAAQLGQISSAPKPIKENSYERVMSMWGGKLVAGKGESGLDRRSEGNL